MPVIRNFTEANELLRGLYENYSHGVAGDFYTLDRMRDLMHLIGDPQNKLKVIHVAGTSGKSSTCYYLASLLRTSGVSVGLCVSPHIIEINERVQINMQPLSEKIFCKEFGIFWDIAFATGLEPSYFEVLVAFAYWEFARQNLDYVVMEVGVGGLLDGTNVIQSENKVCVITDIGLDHTKLLGNTIPEIAFQKAGIIERHNHVFMYEQGEDVMWVVRKRCEEKEALLHTIPDEVIREEFDLPLFQQRNFHLALQAAIYVLQRDGQKSLKPAQIRKAAQITVPGRMEVFRVRGRVLIVDGAHNEQKMTALVRSIQAAYPDQPIAALVSAVHGQEERWRKSLDVLLPIVSSCIVTSFYQEEHDRIKRSVDAEDIGMYLQDTHDLPVRIEPDVKKAFALLLHAKEPVLLVTGSLYLLSDILRLVASEKSKITTPTENSSVPATGDASRK